MKKQRTKKYRSAHLKQAEAYWSTTWKLPLSHRKQVEVGIWFRTALELVLGGRAKREDMDVVSTALNIALVLAQEGYGPEWQPRIEQALEGMKRAYERLDEMGRGVLDGPGMTAVKEAFEVHDEQLRLATAEEVRNALKEVARRYKERDEQEVPA